MMMMMMIDFEKECEMKQQSSDKHRRSVEISEVDGWRKL